MEIGSEFWWDGHFKNPTINQQLSNLDNAQFFSSGRGALEALLTHINLSKGRVLLPEYLCDSMVQPFIRHGYSIYFYSIDKKLTPILDSKLDLKDIDLFLNIDYFGFDTSKKRAQWIKTLHPSVLIIQDVTHSWLTGIEKEYDFAFASLRKWLALPSGGMLKGLELPVFKTTEDQTFIALRKKALLEKAAYRNNKSQHKSYLDLFSQAEKLLEQQPYFYKMDTVSKEILQTTDFKDVIRKRRANYQYLLDHLDPSRVEIISDTLDETVCPFFFPVFLENRADTRATLTANQIYCPIHWPLSPYIKELSPTGHYIYQHILSIPIDQRYNEKDMAHIVAVLNQ